MTHDFRLLLLFPCTLLLSAGHAQTKRCYAYEQQSGNDHHTVAITLTIDGGNVTAFYSESKKAGATQTSRAFTKTGKLIGSNIVFEKVAPRSERLKRKMESSGTGVSEGQEIWNLSGSTLTAEGVVLAEERCR